MYRTGVLPFWRWRDELCRQFSSHCGPVGTGRAVLRPLLGEARQFVPTDLGLRRQEMVLCLAEASLPLEEQPGNWVLQQGERFYGVRNVSAVEAGRERIYWRAVLVRQEGDVT